MESVILNIGLVLLISWLTGQIFNFIGAPRVTGYLLAGLAFSPDILPVFTPAMLNETLEPFSHIGLAIIAFSVGGGLRLKNLARIGNTVMGLTIIQGVMTLLVATAFVFPALLFWGESGPIGPVEETWRENLALALVAGVIGIATAPATVLAIIHQNRAQGRLTTLLLGVVALDDALTIIAFSLVMPVVAWLLTPGETVEIARYLLPVARIFLAMGLGASLGFLLKFTLRFHFRRADLFALILAAVILATGLSDLLEVSNLLTNMTMGFVAVNFIHRQHSLFDALEITEEAVFGILFFLAGAHLDLGALKTGALLAMMIFVGRGLGKYLGAFSGAVLFRQDSFVKKNLGLGLLPQAGVAIGLMMEARQWLPEPGRLEIIFNGIIGAVIMAEIIAPVLLDRVIKKSGEGEVKDA